MQSESYTGKVIHVNEEESKMKLTNKAKGYFTALAAAASFLNAAPVLAAPNTTENKTAETANVANVNARLAGLSLNGLGTYDNNTVSNTVSFKSGMIEKDGKIYYQNDFGQNVTGLVADEDNEYYFGDDGSMVTGWVQNGDGWYYFAEDGTRQTGEIVDQGAHYILAEDGTLTTGWVENGDAWNYYDEDGARIEGTTVSIAGVNYTFDADGTWEKPVQIQTQAQTQTAEQEEVTPAEYAQNTAAYNDSRYQAIANAAIAQIGVTQDCTRLVSNSLAAVGINFHGAPAKYLSLGEVTNNPVPGDIIVYQGHVAIYIGNGRAIHGGWFGHTTAEYSVECSAPFVAFVHPRLP